VAVDLDVVVDVDASGLPLETIRYTASTVELVHKERRVAAHVRSYNRGAFTTIPEHMPRSHREAREWSPGRLIRWASESGPSVKEFVETILRERPHPEHGYRACLGILRLGKKYGTERLDAACARGLRIGARSYRNIHSILKSGLDRQPLQGSLPEAAPPSAPLLHENIRGPRHYT
jgi:transposase